ncbi:MAG: SDR family NAD(P)-dependent oxidoreductase [Pseudomonadota bacterium]
MAQLWIVTGAASGIGAAVTQRVRGQGHDVLALDVNDEAGTALVTEHGAEYLHCDVSRQDHWAEVVSRVQQIGTPTHIHLNAGIQIAPPEAPMEAYRFEALELERYRLMMGVNVDGVVFGLQALLPLLQPGASIVVTASLAGITPYAVDPLYAMSKHAVVGLVRSLAEPLARREITINALCPGGIDTNIIPHAQRTDKAIFMTADHVAEEVQTLMDAQKTGKTWAKVAQEKPLFIVRAPGDKG